MPETNTEKNLASPETYRRLYQGYLSGVADLTKAQEKIQHFREGLERAGVTFPPNAPGPFELKPAWQTIWEQQEKKAAQEKVEALAAIADIEASLGKIEGPTSRVNLAHLIEAVDAEGGSDA